MGCGCERQGPLQFCRQERLGIGFLEQLGRGNQKAWALEEA